MNRAKLQFS